MDVQQAAETVCTWVGFCVICGTTAKLILPGKDPGGTIITLLLGLGGAFLGAAIYAWAGGEQIGAVISLMGLAVSIGGALLLLIAHRVLSGRILKVTDNGEIVPAPKHRRRKNNVRVVQID